MADLPAPDLPAKIEPKLPLSDLWRWNGVISPRRYMGWGTGLFSIKYAIDYVVAQVIFHRMWLPWSYFVPGQSLDVMMMSADDRRFFATLLVLSLPFIWTGIVMTIRRLRDAGISVFWCKLFFMPFVNCLMFSMLCMIPSKKEDMLMPVADQNPDALIQSDKLMLPKSMEPQIVPTEQTGVALGGRDTNLPALAGARNGDQDWAQDFLFANVSTVPFAMVFSWLGMFILQNYGWGMFVGIPFALGLSSAFLYGRNKQRTIKECLIVSTCAMFILGGGILLTAWEGVGCLVMASPIALVLAYMGALLGYNMQKRPNIQLNQLDRTYPIMSLLIAVPVCMGGEHAAGSSAPVKPVVTTMEIAAPPEEVWKHVIAFPLLKPPTELIFKTGIAYPIGATIDGTGIGAVRHCKFSTGEFVEPITVWQPPSRLEFDVISQPATMRETTWAREIQPAHLHGYLNVERGQFCLYPIQRNGITGTRIVGSTWYQNNMWPNLYWRVWSDNIIHAIHLRVLNHIKEQAEMHVISERY